MKYSDFLKFEFLKKQLFCIIFFKNAIISLKIREQMSYTGSHLHGIVEMHGLNGEFLLASDETAAVHHDLPPTARQREEFCVRRGAETDRLLLPSAKKTPINS